jgi:hypothetical protein
MSYYDRQKQPMIPGWRPEPISPVTSGNAATGYVSWQHTARLNRPPARAEEGEETVPVASYGSG